VFAEVHLKNTVGLERRESLVAGKAIVNWLRELRCEEDRN